MRHYLNEHPKVNRHQDIIVCCPFPECPFEQAWPIQSLYFHVENVHGKEAREAALQDDQAKSLKTIDETRPDGRTPIRIVGRPTVSSLSSIFFHKANVQCVILLE